MLLAGLAWLIPPGLAHADNSYEACFRHRVNSERVAVGVPTLTDNATVDGIASDHSDQMAADQTIYHNNDLDADYNRELGGYEYGGENVGMGPDCKSIHAAFKASHGHYENMIDPDYTHLGVGVTVGRDGELYVTEDFWTPKNRPARRPSTSKPQDCKP
jgi:uncharacterized protein YkwD